MSVASRADMRFALRLALAFAAWSVAALGLLPAAARLVVPAAAWLLAGIEPHGARVVFSSRWPLIAWQVTAGGLVHGESLPCRLVTYNLVLYLALLTAVPGWPLGQRVRFAAAGIPLLLALQVVDLVLTVESRLLTVLRPEAYDFWRSPDAWFVLVKAYGSLSVLALRQAVPVLLLWAQWRYRAPRTAGRRRLDPHLPRPR